MRAAGSVLPSNVFPQAKEFGGLKVDQARRMKKLETGNARLRWATLDKLILKETDADSIRRRLLMHYPDAETLSA